MKDLLEFLDKNTNENANEALKRFKALNPPALVMKKKNVRKS